jgi:hypothetical protein
MEACRTNAARVERIPAVSASAQPQISLAGDPGTERAADARAGIIDLFFVADFAFNLGVDNRWSSHRSIIIGSIHGFERLPAPVAFND